MAVPDPVSEYGRLEITGTHATLELEPDAVELLLATLDGDLEDLETAYRTASDDALDGLELEIDELAGLRDALHSVALELET